MSDFFNVLVAKLHKQVFFLLLYGTVLSSSITLINLATFIVFDPFCFDRKKKQRLSYYSTAVGSPFWQIFIHSHFFNSSRIYFAKITEFSPFEEWILQHLCFKRKLQSFTRNLRVGDKVLLRLIWIWISRKNLNYVCIWWVFEIFSSIWEFNLLTWSESVGGSSI